MQCIPLRIETVEDHTHRLSNIWILTCKVILGKKSNKRMEWLSSDTWNLITNKRNLTQNCEDRQELQVLYYEINRQMKKSAGQDKRTFVHHLTEEAETAVGKRDTKRLYKITRVLSGKNKQPHSPCRRQEGRDHHWRR